MTPSDIDCLADGEDCKIIYKDINSLFFVDCDAAACTTPTLTIIDTSTPSGTDLQVSLDCVSANDCKGTWLGTSANEYFFDCDAVDCTSGSAVIVPGSSSNRTAVSCPATNDCKLAYAEANGDTPTIKFADCTNGSDGCLPEASDPDDPWTGLTNLSSVSLSYESSETKLYAHTVYGTDTGTEQAYWRNSPAGSISWSAETSYGFTPGDIAEISSPLTGAAPDQIAVVARQGGNFEFAPVPERIWMLLAILPFMPKMMSQFRQRRRKRLVLNC